MGGRVGGEVEGEGGLERIFPIRVSGEWDLESMVEGVTNIPSNQ